MRLPFLGPRKPRVRAGPPGIPAPTRNNDERLPLTIVLTPIPMEEANVQQIRMQLRALQLRAGYNMLVALVPEIPGQESDLVILPLASLVDLKRATLIVRH